MAVTYNWSVIDMKRNLSDGGITQIKWVCEGVDGDHSSSRRGTTIHAPDADAADFIAYNDVTEENAVTWAKAKLDVSDIEAEIARKINRAKTPTTSSGVPWHTPEAESETEAQSD